MLAAPLDAVRKKSRGVAWFVAAAACLSAIAIGIAFGTFAVGGSDSSCYLNEARLLTRGRIFLDEPLARAAPWPAKELTFAPAGYLPSRQIPGAMVPICPPGLPLAMAVFRALRLSEWLVVPLLGALAVWLTFLLGRRIDSPLAGAAAAVLTASSPIFVYQLVQPMTDVPATAWWLLTVVFASGAWDRVRPFAAGLAASMAVLTRPNLLPLALVVAGYLLVNAASGSQHLDGSASGRRAVRAVRLFLIGLLPGLLTLAWLQQAMYGSPLASGYGGVRDLFAASRIVPNLQRYPKWLIETHTPFLALAIAAPAVARGGPPGRAAHIWLCLALAATTLASYLPYSVFDDWWYIRFLLPAIPLLIVLSVVGLVALVRRAAPARHGAWTAVVVAMLAAWWTREADQRLAFKLGDWEHHFVEAGRFAAERLPARAAVVTVKYSGSVRYYADRPTVAWNVLDPTSLEPALAFLRDQGHEPYLLLATEEESPFRARFGRASVIGGLDWPPIARVGRMIRVYDPRDRSRYLAGEVVQTEDFPKSNRRAR